MSKIASGLHLKQSRHVDDSGRAFVRFVPEFVPDIQAQGFLTFACYDAWEDDKGGLHVAMNEALANARMVMAQFSESLNGVEFPQERLGSETASKFPKPSGDAITDQMRQLKLEREVEIKQKISSIDGITCSRCGMFPDQCNCYG